MTDNLLKYVSVNVTNNQGTALSSEIELDIPRGYIAKIHRMKLETYNLGVDLADQDADLECQIASAIVRDPDDSTNITPPNSVKHDILHYMTTDIMQSVSGVGSSLLILGNEHDTGFIPESVDVITARNLRLNSDQFGANKSLLTTSSGVRAHVWYTYEKVTNTDLAELLDIL